MRLGTCIAFELALAVGAIGGVWLGVGHAVHVANDYLSEREASAATRESPGPRLLAPTHIEAASLAVAPPEGPKTVFEASDDVLLAPIGAAPVTRIKLNHGGTSLSLRLDFANGARASFKPEQIFAQSDPRREVAAYRIDRLLGIGHVAPAKLIKFTVADLVAAADPQLRTFTAGRIADEAIARGTELRGEVQWWIPEIKDAKIGRYRVDETESIEEWTGYLQVGVEIPPAYRPLVEQLATLCLFDVLIDNSDRWTGYNTKASPDQRVLYFMDNTLAFSQFTWGHDNNLRPFRRMQKFPRGLVSRLRALTRETIAAVLDDTGQDEGLGPLLKPAELDAIIARRDHMIEQIDRLIAQYGEDAVLALP